MTTNLTPRPGHVVAVSALPTCDVCGEEAATWDVRTRFGPWANACDLCVENVAAQPGVTGVGVGQRLVLAREATAPDLRLMLVPDRSEAFTREGRSLVTDPPAPVPPAVREQAARERAVLEGVSLALALRRYREHVGEPQLHEEVSAWLAERG